MFIRPITTGITRRLYHLSAPIIMDSQYHTQPPFLKDKRPLDISTPMKQPVQKNNRFNCSFSALINKFSSLFFGPLDPTLSADYHGPSYRYVNFKNVDDLKQYINSGGLTNNYKTEDGKNSTNLSVELYVRFNLKSPWFGGCAFLTDIEKFVKNPKEEDGFVIFIKSLPENDVRTKTSANIEYYNKTGKSNPREYENEVLHKGGDFGDLAVHAISIKDLKDAIEGKDVQCCLTGKPFNVAAWHSEEKLQALVATHKRLEM